MRKWIIALLVIVALIIAACGGDESTPAPVTETVTEVATKAAVEEAPTVEATSEATTEATGEAAPAAESSAPSGALMLPAVNPLAVSGDIIAAGSSTVYPLAERMAERFIAEGYAGNITIDSIGSGAGFERFCVAGETDISNASRPIRDSEIESCGSIGRTPIEFRVGTDALAVVVNPENDWIGPEGVTVEELAKLFSAETTNWSDVNPAWPEEPVKRFSPGTDSGTFDFFIEAVMDATYENGEEQLLSGANLQLSEDDNVLVQGVAGDKNGIGYFGYAYFEENAGRLRDLAIEGISPSEETVDRGEYPLARPLFVYSDANIMSSKPQVADYINFLLSNVNEEIISVGYFPASDEALNQAKQSWLDAMGMEGAAMETTAAAASMALPAVNPLAVSGDIIAAGSSTVYPLAERMAERFIAEGYAGNITIDSIGSGAGFERFCVAGETDISNASRPIRDSEIESCGSIGRTPIEFRVGTDALAVVVNPENDWIGPEGVTVEELAKLFSAETTNWSDVNPAWPEEPVKRFSPGTDSGTFDFFIEAVMDATYENGEEQLLSAANLQLSEDDNVLVQGVAGDRDGIGYFGYAYFEENAGRLRDLAIEGISPSEETVDRGEYPLARPLFVYSDANIMSSKPQVADYINFLLSNVNEEIIGVGYFPASDEALNQAKQSWLDAMGQ